MHTASALETQVVPVSLHTSRLNFAHKNRQHLCASCDEELHDLGTGVYPFLCSTCLDFEVSAFETQGRVAYGGEA